MIKSLRLTYLHFIEVTFVNDISISTQYKAYKDEMWLPTLSNIFPYKSKDVAGDIIIRDDDGDDIIRPQIFVNS